MSPVAFSSALALLAVNASAPPASALHRLVHQVEAEVGSAVSEGTLGVYVDGDRPELTRAFATLLISALSTSLRSVTPIHAPDATAAEELARERGTSALLRLHLRLERGVLYARGDLLGTWVNFWSGQTLTRPRSPAASLALSVDADAHALALATGRSEPFKSNRPLRLVGRRLASLPHPPAALTAGDLDADGRPELVVLTSEETLVFSAQGALRARLSHRSLDQPGDPPAPIAAREPFGGVVVVPEARRIGLALAHRAQGAWLTFDQETLHVEKEPLKGAPLFQSGRHTWWGTILPGRNHFGPIIEGLVDPPLVLDQPITTLSGWAEHQLVVHPDGTGRWLQSGQPRASLRGLGAASTLGDFDGDRTPELFTSSTEYAPEPDPLRIVTIEQLQPLESGAKPRDVPAHTPAWTSTTVRGRAVQAVAADLDGDGADELLLGVWLSNGEGEVQLFRGGER